VEAGVERDGRDLGIPGFEDAEVIGRGGFGTVYRAWEPGLGRRVAVKVLSSRLDDRGRVLFERERRALGALSGHPHVVTVHSWGVLADGSAYLVMEHLEGGSLAERVAALGARPWDEAVDTVVRVAGALESAHRAGVLHRDVKPDNVLVGAFDQPKLVDFGIAALGGVHTTDTGSVTASLAYAAPEVLGGQRGTPASDVYSLGATLFALLAGTPAFVEATDETALPVLARVASQPVPDLRGRGVPEPVCRAIERGMAKEPGERFASAADLAESLRAAQRELGCPATAAASPSRSCRRASTTAAACSSSPTGGRSAPSPGTPMT
jgi:serine/threonine protein kinase